ncbi:response regulator [Paenibacillus sp. G2S3]|uniref:response regulator transcription factor n=1 Tax=Paenibacillus sp. G2S3 TaxID=3047872 RepID=UPI0024C199F3|nr:helix-turn-helix domain-containing protein [Paenibacillus sp. G2S3]WHY21403.1 response regulator [Paenibacillus sp. G2S3]
MKIVIADDEFLAQQTLLSMIREIKGDWEIVGVAGSGIELLDIVLEKRPDIAFVDIKMPGMNGIEAIRRAKAGSADTEWFILSGYSEFAFAQEGIQLGVKNYLLKPLSLGELREALLMAQTAVQERLASKQRLFANTIWNRNYGLESAEARVKEQASMQVQLAVVFVDSYLLDERATSIPLKQVYTYINQIIEEFANQGLLLTWMILPGGHIAVVGASRHGNHDKELLDGFFQELQQMMDDSDISSEIRLTVVSSQAQLALDEIGEQVDEIVDRGIYRMLKGLGKIWNASSFRHFNGEHYELCSRMAHLVQMYKEKKYTRYMDELFEMKQYTTVRRHVLEGNGIREALYDYLNTTLCVQLEPAASFAKNIILLKTHGNSLLQRMNKDEPPQDIVYKVIQYMKSNYRDEIGTTRIAGHFQVSPNYLSTVFHQKTGSTIMRFLTELRINKAKEILAVGDLQIQEAAELVGYINPAYFTNLFKKFEGCSPTEYKQMLR